MQITVEDITAELIRSNRKTLAIEVKADRIIVRAPRRASRSTIQDFILRKMDWIQKHQHALQIRQRKMSALPAFGQEELQELTRNAKEYIPARVAHYAELVGVDYGRITIRHQKTRWGSCSSAGNLNFNCLLMLFPEDVIDSVVVHELCHRKHMNHSRAFYQEVERVFPRYRECHRWLKEHGSLQLHRLE